VWVERERHLLLWMIFGTSAPSLWVGGLAWSSMFCFINLYLYMHFNLNTPIFFPIHLCCTQVLPSPTYDSILQAGLRSWAGQLNGLHCKTHDVSGLNLSIFFSFGVRPLLCRCQCWHTIKLVF
jgi:hypothetical protein